MTETVRLDLGHGIAHLGKLESVKIVGAEVDAHTTCLACWALVVLATMTHNDERGGRLSELRDKGDRAEERGQERVRKRDITEEQLRRATE